MAIPIILTTKATIHAITHCPTTTPAAHRVPNSLLIEAMAATHGVYKRQKTSRLAAPSGFSISARDAVFTKQHRQRRYHTFLCHKACDQCG